MKARQYVFGIHGLREADKLVNLSHMLKVFRSVRLSAWHCVFWPFYL